MVKLYVKKIVSGAINPATGEAWKIEDVPSRWREVVREALENRPAQPRDVEMVEAEEISEEEN